MDNKLFDKNGCCEESLQSWSDKLGNGAMLTDGRLRYWHKPDSDHVADSMKYGER